MEYEFVLEVRIRTAPPNIHLRVWRAEQKIISPFRGAITPQVSNESEESPVCCGDVRVSNVAGAVRVPFFWQFAETTEVWLGCDFVSEYTNKQIHK